MFPQAPPEIAWPRDGTLGPTPDNFRKWKLKVERLALFSFSDRNLPYPVHPQIMAVFSIKVRVYRPKMGTILQLTLQRGFTGSLPPSGYGGASLLRNFATSAPFEYKTCSFLLNPLIFTLLKLVYLDIENI